MTILALIATLLLEQVRPLGDRASLARLLGAALDFLERNLNAGSRHHGVAAWCLAVIPAVALTLAIYYALYHVHAALAWAWNVAILYLTMGFRQFSHHFTDIHKALRDNDLAHARALIGEWRGRPAEDLNSVEVARLAIEEAFAASHRHVFAVLFWFAFLPGPAGALEVAVEARRAGVPYAWRACNAISWPIMQKNYWLKRGVLAWRLKRDLNGAAAMHYATENERDETAWLKLKSPI